MTLIVTAILLAFLTPQETKQERPRVPDDSVRLTVLGCLNGRMLKTVDTRQKDVESGPYVGERLFRLAGKKPVMDEVKKHNRRVVEVVGLVRRADLDDKGVKLGRVTISGGPPVAGRAPDPTSNVPVMDAESVRLRAGSCATGDKQ